MNERRLAFVDVETTGLDFTKHELLEVAVIITDPRAEKIQQTITAKLAPQNIAGAEPRALVVNGYTAAEWAPENCWERPQLLEALHFGLRDVILVGQNVSFDEGFLKAFFREFGRPAPWHYHKVDIASLMWPLFTKGRLSKLSLATEAEYFGLVQPDPHRAEADARLGLEIYRRAMTPSLLERFKNLLP